jgi:hypothetical protein
VEKAAHKFFANVECVSVDFQASYRPTFCAPVEEFAATTAQRYEPRHFDVIWCSPPCTEYSMAKTRAVRDLQKADAVAQACLSVIGRLQPAYWYVENPVGLLRHRPFMEVWNRFRESTTYCMYGTPYKKPTDIWTNTKGRPPDLLFCQSGEWCVQFDRARGRHSRTAQHGAAPRTRGQPGMGDKANVYPVPEKLILSLLQRMHPVHIALACPRAEAGPWGKDLGGGERVKR